MHLRSRRRLAALALSCCSAFPAAAQLRGPALPGAPRVELPTALPNELLRRPLDAALGAPQTLAERVTDRARRIAALLRQQPERLEADPAGAPALRGELVLALPAATPLDALLAEGYTLLRAPPPDALGLRLLTVRVPPGWSTERGAQRLAALLPDAVVDRNHVYLDAGSAAEPPPAPATAASGPVAATGAAGVPPTVRVGLIDSGVDPALPALRGAAVRRWGCDGRVLPGAHGSALAALLVGQGEGLRPSAPGATLYAADVDCGAALGAPVDAVVAALGWLLGEGVAVVNLSLVGPPNRLLALAVRQAADRGQLLVAAVGNDGPAAPPLYPAAYPQVVAVTAVDARRQVLPEAGRGPHVAFSALGAGLRVGAAGRPGEALRGTSYATPVVAGLLAAALPAPDAARAAAAVEALAARAVDLGAPGRDPVYGFGWVGPP